MDTFMDLDISDKPKKHIPNDIQTSKSKSSQMAEQNWNMWFIADSYFVTWRPDHEARQ